MTTRPAAPPASPVPAAPGGGRTRALWLLAGLLLLTLLFIRQGQEVATRQLVRPLGELSLSLASWRAVGPDLALDEPTRRLLNPQDYLLRSYLDPSGRLCALFVAYFGRQQQPQMIHSPRHCLPGAGWRIESRREVAIPGPGGGHLVNQLILGKELERLSVLYWYQGRGRVEADEYRDRLHLILDGVLLNRNDGALVRLTAPDDPRDPGVLERQVRLAAALIPALERILPPR